MSTVTTSQNRRNFLKITALGGGGLILGFNWLTGCKQNASDTATVDLGPELPETWHDINAYLKIGDNGTVTIYTPNPEFGQGVMTAMPMILAEELDVDWKDVISEQAPFNAEKFGFQFTGGSRGIMSRWAGLRQAGATARQMLVAAAAQQWEVPAEEITTKAGRLYHAASDRAMGYGDVATIAAELPMPEEAPLKDLKDFSIIGKSKKNVQGREIVTGKPLFGIDYHKKGMLTAMIVHPPSFGQRFERIRNLDEIKAMPGIQDVFSIKTYKDGQGKGGFDTNAFPELVAIVGDSTWRVMKAKKAVLVDWQEHEAFEETITGFRGKTSRNVPAGLENSADHARQMEEMAAKPGREVRKDGNPERAFATADKVLERSYTAPFLAHNCMEPMNAFAHVEGDKVWIAGPLQAPGMIEPTIAARMDLPVENGRPIVQKVTCAIDCGVVVNPDAAANMAEGGIVDGVGNALFGEMTFTDGKPDKQNFDSYRMIRMSEAPKEIDVHFVPSEVDPTGLGEPPFPPVFGAMANALYRATGKRKYRQPFAGSGTLKG